MAITEFRLERIKCEGARVFTEICLFLAEQRLKGENYFDKLYYFCVFCDRVEPVDFNSVKVTVKSDHVLSYLYVPNYGFISNE